MSKSWIPLSSDDAYKRAAGRRRYLAERRRARDKRHLKIMRIMSESNWPLYGLGRILAKKLSVDPATISRDLRLIRAWRNRLAGRLRKMNREKFLSAAISQFIAQHIPPRVEFLLTYHEINGVSSLIVRRYRGYIPAWVHSLKETREKWPNNESKAA
jgi:hypothetical protein